MDANDNFSSDGKKRGTRRKEQATGAETPQTGAQGSRNRVEDRLTGVKAHGDEATPAAQPAARPHGNGNGKRNGNGNGKHAGAGAKGRVVSSRAPRVGE